MMAFENCVFDGSGGVVCNYRGFPYQCTPEDTPEQWEQLQALVEAGKVTIGQYVPPPAPVFDPAMAISAILPARETVLNRLTGIRQDADDAGDQALIAACKAARQGIKDLPNAPGVPTATNADDFRAALLSAYGKIVQAAPDSLAKAFREISL